VAGKLGYIVRAAALVLAAIWGLGCNLDRSGLNVSYLVPDGSGGFDVGGGDDVRDAGATDVSRDVATDQVVIPDAPVEAPKDATVDLPEEAPPKDAPVDLPRDVAVDMPITCDASTHKCGNACVSDDSVQSCGTSCTACPVPANGSATCNGTSCGLACNAGFTLQGSTCLACNLACDAGATMVMAPGGRFTGKTNGASTSTGSCGGGSAPEAAYRLVLAQPSDVFVTTHGTGFDTVLYMRRGTCCGQELACNDNADGRTTSVLSQQNLPAGTYYVFVDGAKASESGDFTVDIYITPTATAAADTCARAVRIADTAVSGDTCGMNNDYDQPPGCLNVPNSGPDMVYYFVLDTRSTVSFSTCNATCFDTVLYIRDVCSMADPQSPCNDDDNVCGKDQSCALVAGVPSTVSAVLDPGVHYLILDTYPTVDSPGLPTCGAFSITPVGVPP